MSRAEERALEAYPAKRGHLHDMPFLRDGFIHGYEQAEKDLALTWEDMELLHRLFAEEEDNFSKHDKYFYTEVLTRFKQYKEAKQ